MFLKDTASGNLVEVLDMGQLIDPNESAIQGRFHAGEELQDGGSFDKSALVFPSGEALPQCWTDVAYRQG